MSPFYPLLLIHVHIMSAEMSIAVEWIESMGIACLPMTPAQDILMMPAPAWIFDTYCMQYICFIARMCVEKRLPPQKYTCCSENFNLHSQRRDSGTNTPATLKHAASAQQVPDRTQSLTDISIHVLQECRLREWQALQAKTWVGNSLATHVWLSISAKNLPSRSYLPMLSRFHFVARPAQWCTVKESHVKGFYMWMCAQTRWGNGHDHHPLWTCVGDHVRFLSSHVAAADGMAVLHWQLWSQRPSISLKPFSSANECLKPAVNHASAGDFKWPTLETGVIFEERRKHLGACNIGSNKIAPLTGNAHVCTACWNQGNKFKQIQSCQG